MDREIDEALSSSSGEDAVNFAVAGGKGKKRQSRLTPKLTSDESKPQERVRYQPREEVEARFGGRSKWFPGKVRRAFEGPTGDVLYDVDFDDGDKEEGVLGGRVRRPGQGPPSLGAGLAVDVKLARKGKGYHPGTIGRVNDDGSLYVKLGDGDSEWSIPAQQVIPSYPYAPPTAAPLLDGNSAGASSDRTAAREAGRGENGSGDRDVVDGRTGSQPCSPSTVENAPPASAVGGDNPASQQAFTRNATPGSPPSSPPPPASHGGVKHSNDNNQQNGDGINWIAELVTSEAVLSPGPQIPGAAPDADTDEQRDDVGGRNNGGGAFDWIADVVSPVRLANAREPPLSGRGPNTRRSTLIASGPSALLATETRPPAALIPTHLEWKPIMDGSAKRRWGAPPPDVVETSCKGEEDGVGTKTQQHQCQPNSPPRISRNTAAPTSSSAANIQATSSATSVAASSYTPADGRHGSNAVANATGGEGEKPIAPAVMDASQGQRPGGGAPAPATVGREGTLVLQSPECDDRKTQAADTSNDATIPIPEGSQDEQCTEALSTQQQRMKSFQPLEQTHSTPPVGGCPGEPQNALPPLQEKSSATGQGCHGESRQLEIVQSSVQRRFAAEAIHLSEEVRLLTAKLKVADDKARAKLAEQERKLVGQMEEALQRERDKMKTLLSEERVSSARRMNGLKEELYTARLQLELERNKNLKVGDKQGAPPGGRATLRGRQSKTPPPLHHATAAGRGQKGTGNTSSSPEGVRHFLRNSALNGPGKPVRRPRSASSTVAASTASLGTSERYVDRRYPPPPPLSLTTTNPGNGYITTGATATASKGVRGPLFSERMKRVPPALSPSCGGGGDGAGDGGDKGGHPQALESLVRDFLATAGGLAAKDEPSFHELKNHEEGDAIRIQRRGKGEYTEWAPPPPPHQRRARGTQTAGLDNGCREEQLRWQLETERRDTCRRLEAMKGEVERVVGQLRQRVERAEAAASSAEQRAKVNALRYLRSRRSLSPVTGLI